MVKKIELPNQEILNLYRNEHKSTIKIAEIYNVSPTTISKRLKEENVEIIKGKGLPDKKIIDLYQNKHVSCEEIAKIFLVDGETIRKVLKRNECEMRKKPNGFFKNMTQEEWLTYGGENYFNKLTRRDLLKKASWYYKKGLNEKWIDKLIFPPIIRMTRDQWFDYGREKEYDKLSRFNLSKKANAYYRKGIKEKWMNDFILKQNSLEQQLIAYGGK